MADESVKRKRTKLWVAICVIAAIVVCCGGAYLYFSVQVAKDSGIDAAKLDELKTKAQKRRDDAVAAKKADEEKRAAEEKAAEEKKVAENMAANDGHSFMTDYFYVDVPSEWKSSEWRVEQIDDHTWIITHMPANDYGGAISIAVAKDNPWPQYGTEDLGATGTGLNVYMGNGAGDDLAKYLKIELTKTWNPDDPDSVRADGFSNSDYQDIAAARQRLREEQMGNK